jgi:uncharacterized protein (TIGR03083 family)
MTSQHADQTQLQARIEVLGGSVERLAHLVASLTPEQLRQQAYPTEWTVADVLSHLGSGAVITQQGIDGGAEPQAVWDEWNAKDPDAQAADEQRADADLQQRLAALTAEEAAGLRFSMGPREIDLITMLGLRISEHALHTWDIAVTFDPSATVPPDAAEIIVDNLAMIASFAGKPTGADRSVKIRTSRPNRQFEVSLRADGVDFSPTDEAGSPDLELSSDALIRLVYGRLDPDHSPALEVGAGDLDELRKAFPGF